MEKFLHGFNLIPGTGYSLLKKLHRFFGNWKEAWINKHVSLYIKAGITQKFAEKVMYFKSKINLQKEYEKLVQRSIVMITPEKDEYPNLLRHIPNPPYLLYRKGAPLHKDHNYIAIVGTRLPTSYGEIIAYRLSEGISQNGGIVVSGMAFGIDTKAHVGAVKNHKPTIAIVASELIHMRPTSQFNLAQEIINHGGTLLSEYATNNLAHKGRYHERNRLISGISKATIIIEAKMKSGALITAHHALEQNRSIYVLPGDITRPQSQGCLKLLKEGAIPLISIEETLEELGFLNLKKPEVMTIQEKIIVERVENGPCTTQELLYATGLPLPALNKIMTSLEFKNIIYKNKALLWEKS